MIVYVIPYFNFENKRNDQEIRRLLRQLDNKSCIVPIHSRSVGEEDGLQKEYPNVSFIRIKFADILWQKERFINISFELIKEKYIDAEYIAWIDADVMFMENDFEDSIIEALQQYNFIQCFSHAYDVFIHRKDNIIEKRSSAVKKICEGSIGTDYLKSNGKSLEYRVCPGHCWATSTELFEKIYLPEFMILGSGDKFLLSSLFGFGNEYIENLSQNRSLKIVADKWLKQLDKCKLSIGYSSNKLLHVPKGIVTFDSRKYKTRYSIIDTRFDFSSDIFLGNSNEGWHFTECMDCNIKSAIEEYIFGRSRFDSEVLL